MLRLALIPALMLLSWPVFAARPVMPMEAALRDLQTTDLRVTRAGWRLITGNAARCPERMPGTGLLLHALPQYPPGPAREAAVALHPGLAGLAVSGIVTASPAAAAGLQIGDEITAINGKPVSTLAAGRSHPTALRDAAEQELAALPPALPLVLSITRTGIQQDVALVPVPVCRTRLEVVPGPVIRARSDRSIIQIGQHFADGIDDDGLATVLAHELAHIVLDHHARLLEAGRSLPARQRKVLARQFEDEADRLSLVLLLAGGWDPLIAPRFLRRSARDLDRFRHGGVHRPARERADRLDQALAKRPAHGP
ncbi:MAG: PDZ domain-containing protein [Sphingomonadaceae bacterium]|nr:PDZ domain-containing protein [Sphingomonadaceae bacterium]